jgi:hypothetical protein
MSSLGDGGLNLPFEENSEVFDTIEEMIVVGGMVVVAAMIPVGQEWFPALMFRFVLPDGIFLPPVTLVAADSEIEALIPLVEEAAKSAVKKVRERRLT